MQKAEVGEADISSVEHDTSLRNVKMNRQNEAPHSAIQYAPACSRTYMLGFTVMSINSNPYRHRENSPSAKLKQLENPTHMSALTSVRLNYS
ncbi:predicted protein [Plenodomus lingam JN3]|uniref:Predicted protein n=1 Tax=Leptosphaeria maculans (strain JN3 / isolate v23.1.3 / race Av1-4-5-6-7-8) TaxID=985895 RepID=E4ZJB2_LEPMJ|nr:predicted protein [Plenodomus lingam JN3]CBX91543.1 predicted protein [Plenodomus lingam JN3]